MKIIRAKDTKGDARSDGRVVKRLLDINDLTLYLCEVPQGKFASHYHTSSTEIIAFPRGGRITINEQTFDMEPWDIAIMEMGDIHGFSGDCGDILHFAIKFPRVEDKVDA